MLPQFSILQKMYLGDILYGGLYDDPGVRKYLFGERNLPDEVESTPAACILRMSAVLNVTTNQDGSRQGGTKDTEKYYYFYDRDKLSNYLKKMYGEPIESNKTETFRGKAGIMFINLKGQEESKSKGCNVLLWNGNGFHQGIGLLSHQNLSSAQLWDTPTGM